MKVKKILSLLAATTMTVTAITGAMTASASEVANGTCGDGITWTLDSDGKLTISGKGEMASAPTYDGNGGVKAPVIEDYEDVYTYKKEHKEDIKEVVIEEGVTSIGYCAFYKMPNLETVVLPSTIRKFNGSVEGRFNDGICYSYAFAECTSLRNLTLTEGMTALGGAAFEGCTSLESVRIPSTLIRDTNSEKYAGNSEYDWGDYTFRNCTSLKNITLPEGLTFIGIAAFQNTGVESIVIPSTIEKWEQMSGNNGNSFQNCAFAKCAKLSSVTFKEGIKCINNSPFIQCPSLKRIIIPASVTDISYAFASGAYMGDRSNSEFDEIAFEDNSQLTEIGVGALAAGTHIKILEIPENVTNIMNDNKGNTIDNIYCYSKTATILYTLKYENAKVYCYPDSTVYNELVSKNITPIDISSVISSKLEELNTAVAEAEKYPEKDYTAESYGKLKTLLDEAATKNNESHVLGLTYLTEDIYTAIKGLEKKPPEDNTSGKESDSSNSQQQTPNKTTPQTPTTARPTKSTRSAAQVKKDKSAAKKAMKQAKITKLTAKSKAKKKITVSWKKVKNAKGYQVQVSAKKNFKKVIYNKSLTKNKLTIKSSKIKSKKTYYVRVRAYATYKDANNATKKIYSKWVKKIRKVKAK